MTVKHGAWAWSKAGLWEGCNGAPIMQSFATRVKRHNPVKINYNKARHHKGTT